MRPAAKSENLGLEENGGKNSGDRAGGAEADAKVAASENKAGENMDAIHFYAHIVPQTWGESTSTGPARISAVFIFRTAPQAAAEAQPVAAPPAVAAPAKK